MIKRDFLIFAVMVVVGLAVYVYTAQADSQYSYGWSIASGTNQTLEDFHRDHACISSIYQRVDSDNVWGYTYKVSKPYKSNFPQEITYLSVNEEYIFFCSKSRE